MEITETFMRLHGIKVTWLGHATFLLETPGGTRVLENANCANQAFTLGKHLGMQCHVEMTEALIRNWCKDDAGEIEAVKAGTHRKIPLRAFDGYCRTSRFTGDRRQVGRKI